MKLYKDTDRQNPFSNALDNLPDQARFRAYVMEEEIVDSRTYCDGMIFTMTTKTKKSNCSLYRYFIYDISGECIESSDPEQPCYEDLNIGTLRWSAVQKIQRRFNLKELTINLVNDYISKCNNIITFVEGVQT